MYDAARQCRQDLYICAFSTVQQKKSHSFQCTHEGKKLAQRAFGSQRHTMRLRATKSLNVIKISLY